MMAAIALRLVGMMYFCPINFIPMSLDFYQEIAEETSLFEKKFHALISGDFPLIDNINKQIFKSKGKQLRPLLVLLSHKLFRPKVAEQAYLAASLIEIVHAASLVHDDVVDMADLRRGNPSVRSLFGNKAAVLAGDYLLANAFLKAYDESDNQLLLFLVEVIRKMSEGELIQLEHAGLPQSDYQTYFHVIERKTAALFGCCCQCGAYTAGANGKEIETAREIGMNAGIAFQIKDDLLDMDPLARSGKTYGNDLKEGKLTLPVLYYLQQCGKDERNAFFSSIQTLTEHQQSPQAYAPLLDRLLLQVRQAGGLDYARQQAEAYAQKAFEAYHRLRRPLPAFETLLSSICQPD